MRNLLCAAACCLLLVLDLHGQDIPDSTKSPSIRQHVTVSHNSTLLGMKNNTIQASGIKNRLPLQLVIQRPHASEGDSGGISRKLFGTMPGSISMRVNQWYRASTMLRLYFSKDQLKLRSGATLFDMPDGMIFSHYFYDLTRYNHYPATHLLQQMGYLSVSQNHPVSRR
jgi:hypothetical protein